MRQLRFLAATAVVALACRRDAKGDTVDARDTAFVATMVELRRLAAGDSATRAAVLRRRGVTRDSLERVARALAADPKRAALVWGEIERRESSAGAESALPSAAGTGLRPLTTAK